MTTNPRGLTALVVEDEPLIGRVCQRTLAAIGFGVDIAPSNLIARRMVAEKHYDLCLSDIRTPYMSGIELYEYLAQAQPALAGRTIFTTGDVLSDQIESFLAGTGQPFLAKPFTPEELQRAARQLCGGLTAPSYASV